MYLVLVEKSGAEDGLSSIEIMFYNSFLSLPFLSILIIVTGEFPNSLSLLLAKCSYLPFLVILILSLVMGIVLNFTMFLCTIVNSALTTTIVGVLKGVGSTVSINPHLALFRDEIYRGNHLLIFASFLIS
jgi:solute carrier family 35 protein